MKSLSAGKFLVFITVLSLSQFSQADTASAIRTVAGILAEMNHFASDDEKATLRAIAADESNGAGIRAVAVAVANIQHSANDQGKETMARVMAAQRAAPAVKTLAGIVAEFNHAASEEAKTTLQSLL